jgi:outer membrane lipoprotein SlyB
MGATGAIVPYFFLHWNETIAGFGAFGLAALGLVIGSLIGRSNGQASAQNLAGLESQ